MSNLRFFSDDALILGATVQLSANAATHATRVMRLSVGDTLVLFNGDGFDYTCELIAVQKNAVLASVQSSKKIEVESSLSITLLQGISSGDRMDFTIQKAVELGVTEIQPINTERSVVKLSAERAEKRVEHWQGVVHAACEQSGRAVVPKIGFPMPLSQWLAKHPHGSASRILLNPVGAKRLAELPKPTGEIQLLIGAEGGLSPQEIYTAITHGFQSIVLGPRILRTETAALTAIASMQTLWGDF
jgi:16S rRNA (uracil1498-N3)-methyltransferase